MTTDSNDDTDRLLNQARLGDSAAVERLLGRYRGRLREMIRFRMNPRLQRRIDPSDVIQETLVIANCRLPDYLDHPAVDFYPWIRDIAWKRLVDLHRTHVVADRRTVNREMELNSAITDASAIQLANAFVAADSEPWQKVTREELRREIHKAMAQLSAEARDVLMLRFVEQLSTREAAQIAGISESALKGRQVRALEKLRLLLDDKLGDAQP